MDRGILDKNLKRKKIRDDGCASFFFSPRHHEAMCVYETNKDSEKIPESVKKEDKFLSNQIYRR